MENTKKLSEINIGRMFVEIQRLEERLNNKVGTLISESEDMSDDVFWSLTGELINKIEEFNNAEKATSIFLQDLINKRYIDCDADCDADTALSYVKKYNEMSGKLYTPLFNVIEGYGDDGYGDIIDAFPLFGRERYEKALKGEIEGNSENQYQGEQYIKLNLFEKLVKIYSCDCYCKYDEKEFEDEQHYSPTFL